MLKNKLICQELGNCNHFQLIKECTQVLLKIVHFIISWSLEFFHAQHNRGMRDC